jgi:UTP--glucose-1-phosphate uridylyltransferase
MVHAGDDFIVSRGGGFFERLIRVFEEYDADAAFCVQRVTNPRRYGVVRGKNLAPKTYRVEEVEEKPKRPKSNVAIVRIYVFKPSIFDCIEEARAVNGSEIELTDAIQGLVDEGGGVYAVELRSDETRIDVGTPESYWVALEATRRRLVPKHAARH